VRGTHKFTVGQKVRFVGAAIFERNDTGHYKIIAHLPDENGDWQYRIQRIDLSRERIARESQLAAIGAP
jgi:hypothetical protein